MGTRAEVEGGHLALRDSAWSFRPARFRLATLVAPNLAGRGYLARPARIVRPASCRRSEVQGGEGDAHRADFLAFAIERAGMDEVAIGGEAIERNLQVQ